jgi:hypothetical protein
MTDIATPTYNLASLTDGQREKQLLSQEKIEAAKIDSAKEIELARLRNQDAARRSRSELIRNVLGGKAGSGS